MTRSAPEVTLFLPTWNAGREFPEILAAMLEQELDRPFEVVAVDSGSTDGTVDFLRRQPVRLYEIPNREFNHGLTRNLGVEMAQGEVVVMAVQDARPADRHWMQRLVDCFADERVAGAFSRQLPRPDANPFVKDRLLNWVAGQAQPRRQSVASAEEFWALAPLERLQRVAFDNVSSAVRRQVVLEVPFRSRAFGEDIDWAQRVVLAGWTLVYEPRSAVIHSHDRSPFYELKRIYADHANLHETLGVHTIPSFDFLVECVFQQASRYLTVAERQPGPLARTRWCLLAFAYSLAENLGQYLGARSARKLREGSRVYRVLDRALRRGV
jgi:rhamnosyltransferase